MDALVRSRVDPPPAEGPTGSGSTPAAGRAIWPPCSSSTSRLDRCLDRRAPRARRREGGATALAFGLEACGDAFAIHTFSSRTRREVKVDTKSFEERIGEPVRKRIAALRPGQYTRIGAALRHATSLLRQAAGAPPAPAAARLQAQRPRPLRGPPRHRGHQEGRARGARQGPFGVRGHRRPAAESYVPFIFGRGGYAMVGHLGRLPEALAGIYRQLVS